MMSISSRLRPFVSGMRLKRYVNKVRRSREGDWRSTYRENIPIPPTLIAANIKNNLKPSAVLRSGVTLARTKSGKIKGLEVKGWGEQCHGTY